MIIKKSSIIGMVIAFVLLPILAIMAFNMLFSTSSGDDTDNALSDYEASIYDTPGIDNPVITRDIPAVKSQHIAAPTAWGVGARIDNRIQIAGLFPHCECPYCMPYDFVLKLREYLQELVLQGDIQDHVLDFTCELSPDGELRVRVTEEFADTRVRRTGNTRQANGVMQREMIQIRHASIFCYECYESLASVVWEERWWEDSLVNIEHSPLGVILEDDTPVFETNIDTEPFRTRGPLTTSIHQGTAVALISECDNGKVFVYVTSVGGLPVHNGWEHWFLWIPCGSFELLRSESLDDEMRLCTCG